VSHVHGSAATAKLFRFRAAEATSWGEIKVLCTITSFPVYSGDLKIFTTKSQKHQGNKEKAASRTTFHLQLFVPSCLGG